MLQASPQPRLSPPALPEYVSPPPAPTVSSSDFHKSLSARRSCPTMQAAVSKASSREGQDAAADRRTASPQVDANAAVA
eukprot:scaffold56081_cov27-Tisochrysis_lutea.AAC.7